MFTLATPSGAAAGIPYVERVTAGADPNARLPLVLVLHGAGGRPDGILERSGMERLAVPARLILPYGFTPRGAGFDWFTDRGDGASFADKTRAAADRLAAMTLELARVRPTLGKPIVTGFSQGGMLSYGLAVLHPEAVRAAFPLSGLIPYELVPAVWPADRDKPRVVAFHGTLDRALSVIGARGTVSRMQAAGLDATLTEHPDEGHVISDTGRRELLRAIEEELRRPP